MFLTKTASSVSASVFARPKRLSEVAQTCLSASAQLWLPVKLCEHDDRDVQLFRQSLMPAEISEISSWRLTCERRLLPLSLRSWR